MASSIVEKPSNSLCHNVWQNIDTCAVHRSHYYHPERGGWARYRKISFEQSKSKPKLMAEHLYRFNGHRAREATRRDSLLYFIFTIYRYTLCECTRCTPKRVTYIDSHIFSLSYHCAIILVGFPRRFPSFVIRSAPRMTPNLCEQTKEEEEKKYRIKIGK